MVKAPPRDTRPNRPVVPSVRATSALIDRLVPMYDPLLNEALAGGLRAGELCGYFASDLVKARQAVVDTVSHYIVQCDGNVLYFALTPFAELDINRRARLVGVGDALTVYREQRDIDGIRDIAEHFADRGTGLVVLDSLDAVLTESHLADWEREAQLTRDAKALSRDIGAPVVVTCVADRANKDNPYADSLVADADVLICVRHDYLTLRKNRHGIAHLKG